jgi:peptide/nickel transport system ATP-binding protein
MSPLYSVRGLVVRVGDALLVDGVSFDLNKGEIVALAGASGAGKSMTAMTPFGLTAATASGSVLLDGRELVGLREDALRPIRWL